MDAEDTFHLMVFAFFATAFAAWITHVVWVIGKITGSVL